MEIYLTTTGANILRTQLAGRYGVKLVAYPGEKDEHGNDVPPILSMTPLDREGNDISGMSIEIGTCLEAKARAKARRYN